MEISPDSFPFLYPKHLSSGQTSSFDLRKNRVVIKLYSKYRKAFQIFFGVEALITLLVIYGLTFGQGFDASPLIPFTNVFHEIMFVFIVIPISSTIGAIIGGYALTPIFLLFHKTIYRKAIYGIQETNPAKIFKHTLQGYYPGLLAFNISSIILLLVPKFRNQLLTLGMLEEAPLVYQYIFENLFLLMFTIALSMFIFSPGWFLIDAGIVYSTEEQVRGTDRPVECRTVGGMFNDYFKGYSGFSIAFSYLQILVVYYGGLMSVERVDIVQLIGFFGIPVYVILTVIPTFILLDLTRDQRIQYVRRLAAKIGITRVVKIAFE